VLAHKPRQTGEAPDALAGEANVRRGRRIIHRIEIDLVWCGNNKFHLAMRSDRLEVFGNCA